MRVRSILVKGAIAGVLAFGSLSMTVGTAHASTGCETLESYANYWANQAWNDWNNYMNANGTAGGQPAADYYYAQYQDDWTIYQAYESRANTCNLVER